MIYPVLLVDWIIDIFMILLQPSETAESETGAMNELNNMLVRELVLLLLV